MLRKASANVPCLPRDPSFLKIDDFNPRQFLSPHCDTDNPPAKKIASRVSKHLGLCAISDLEVGFNSGCLRSQAIPEDCSGEESEDDNDEEEGKDDDDEDDEKGSGQGSYLSTLLPGSWQ